MPTQSIALTWVQQTQWWEHEIQKTPLYNCKAAGKIQYRLYDFSSFERDVDGRWGSDLGISVDSTTDNCTSEFDYVEPHHILIATHALWLTAFFESPRAEPEVTTHCNLPELEYEVMFQAILSCM